MKRCPQCQSKFEDERQFCSECGLPLIELSEEEQPEELPEEYCDQSETQDAAAEAPSAEEPVTPPLSPREEKRAEKQRKKEERLRQQEEKQHRKEMKAAERHAPLSIGRRILAGLLCLLLFLLLLNTALGAALRASTTEKGLNTVLAEIELGQLRVDPYFDDVDEELRLNRLLSEDLERVDVSLSEKAVNKFLRKSTLKSFFAGELAALFDDIYKGRSRYEFDRRLLAEELMDSRNLELLEREDVVLDRPAAERIAKLIDGYGLGDLLSRDEIKEEQPALYGALHYGLSYITLGLLMALSLLVIVLIVRVNRGRIGLSLGDVGGVLIAVGALLSLAALFAQFLPSLWQKLLADEMLIAELSAAVLRSQIHVSLITLGVGLLLTVFGRLLRPRQKKEKPPVEY